MKSFRDFGRVANLMATTSAVALSHGLGRFSTTDEGVRWKFDDVPEFRFDRGAT